MSRKLFLFAAMVLFALALSLLWTASPSAYTQTTSGRPGGVYAYQVQGSHYNACEGKLYTCFVPWVVGSGPVVYRSHARVGRQVISVVYQLQWWNGSAWANWSQKTHQRYLNAGYSSIRMPRIDFLPTRGGYFKMLIFVGWGEPTASRPFGTRLLNYNQSRDYVCNTRFPCSAADGSVYLRSPGV
jgi:hypothetical protein